MKEHDISNLKEFQVYVAAVLTELSSELLKHIVKNKTNLEENGFKFVTDHGVELPHHMTINMGNLDLNLNSESIIQTDCELRFNCLFFNYELGVCAIPVTSAKAKILGPNSESWVSIKTCNKQAHVTCCLKPSSAAKWSNDLFENTSSEVIELNADLLLQAKIEICK
jgi:hypothetical protein